MILIGVIGFPLLVLATAYSRRVGSLWPLGLMATLVPAQPFMAEVLGYVPGMWALLGYWTGLLLAFAVPLLGPPRSSDAPTTEQLMKLRRERPGYMDDEGRVG